VNRPLRNLDLDRLDFSKGDGLVTVVAQDAATGLVLMIAHANREALERTLDEGVLWLWSRSRRALWRKGTTSGALLRIVALSADCDGDAVLARVDPAGPACHTGREACFADAPPLAALDVTLAARALAPPESSYSAGLLADRNRRLKKIGEEAAEFVVACAGDDREAARREGADLLFHLLVAARGAGVSARELLAELESRRSG
jgi:phosphoribosyl-ATP pyrophosphohydrolase/phosphoribosyl-AMP cyclohydrolase